MGKYSFYILNFILSSNILKYPALILLILAILPIIFDESKLSINMLVVGYIILIFVIFMIFKIFIFIFLIKRAQKGSFIYDFFKKFVKDKKFKIKVFICSIIFDIFCTFADSFIISSIPIIGESINFTFSDYMFIIILINLCMGGGLFTSYLALNLWLNDYKCNMIFGENSN